MRIHIFLLMLWPCAIGRVSVEKIESEMSVSGNEIVQNLNMFGDYQNLNTVEGIIDSEISAFLYGLNGEKLAKFSFKRQDSKSIYFNTRGFSCFL